MPTSHWPVDVPILDTHGIFIEPGTPPGPHRLIAGLYEAQSGVRLSVGEDIDFVDLGQIEIQSRIMPKEALHMQQQLDVTLPGVTLLGYDFYKLGHRSAPS